MPSSPPSPERPDPPPGGVRLRLVLLLLLVVPMAAGLAGLRLWPVEIEGFLERAMTWLRGAGPTGWLILAAAQWLVAMFGILPASLIGVAAGVIYGVGLGFSLSAASTMLGALAAFAVSRSAFRPAVASLLRRRRGLEALDAALGRDGWRLVCLVRISPVMPFAPTSYALGLSAVSLRDYLIGTLAALPALLGYVTLGALAEGGLAAWHQGVGPLRWLTLAVGALATIVLTLRVGAIVRRIYREEPAQT